MVDLSVGELQMYGTVEWCNVSDSLGKIKKGTELESTVFVFKTGVVFLCRERLKRRKSRGVSYYLWNLDLLSIVRKGENGGYHYFLFFPTIFSRTISVLVIRT